MYNDNYLAHYGVLGMKWGKKKVKNEKQQFKSDVKEYRKLRSDFGRSISKSVSKKTQDQDLQSNTVKLLTVKDYVDNKRTQKGQEYVDKLIRQADKKDNAKARLGVGAFVVTATAATAGLAYLQAKYDS